jgi:hypothetical protein
MKRCPLDCNPGEPAKCDPLHKSPTIINATLKHRSSNSIATIPARRGGAAARRRRRAAPARPRRPARARPARPLPTLHEQRCHINSQTDAATDRLNPRGLSVAERAVRRPPRNETQPNLKSIVGERRWVGAASFERAQISGRTRHAVKRLSISALFCQLYSYKSRVQLLQSIGRSHVRR